MRPWPRRLQTIGKTEHTTRTFGGVDSVQLTIQLAQAAPREALYKLWQDHAEAGGELRGQYDRFDMSVLAGMINRFGVNKVIECAPHRGWSTTVIQIALPRDCRHKSFDITDYQSDIRRAVERHTTLKNWSFTLGDFKQEVEAENDFLADVDLLFIDADHSQEFARWYLDEARLFDKLKPGALAHVHDVYPIGLEKPAYGESPYVLRWAADNRDKFDVLFNWETARLARVQKALGRRMFLDHSGRQANNCSLWLLKK